MERNLIKELEKKGRAIIREIQKIDIAKIENGAANFSKLRKLQNQFYEINEKIGTR